MILTNKSKNMEKEFTNYAKQLRELTDNQLILLDLIINIYPIPEIAHNIERENIPFDFGYYDIDFLLAIRKLVKINLGLRHIDIL